MATCFGYPNLDMSWYLQTPQNACMDILHWNDDGPKCGPQCQARHSIHEVAMAYEATARYGSFGDMGDGRMQNMFFWLLTMCLISFYNIICVIDGESTLQKTFCFRPREGPVAEQGASSSKPPFLLWYFLVSPVDDGYVLGVLPEMIATYGGSCLIRSASQKIRRFPGGYVCGYPYRSSSEF